MFESVAKAYPEARFEWVDVEDESEVMEDINLATFPTVLVWSQGDVYFFGPLVPQDQVLKQVLSAALEGRQMQRISDEVRELGERLANRVHVIGQGEAPA